MIHLLSGLTLVASPLLGPLCGPVDAFAGRGERLIDYKLHQNSIAIGIPLNKLLDRPDERP